MTDPQTHNWRTLKASMTPEAQRRVDDRTRETLSSMPIVELREAMRLTRGELTGSADAARNQVTSIEHQTDIYLSILRKHVRSLGGDLCLTVEFPDGRTMEIDRFTELAVS